jgi:hypothetical protein
MSNLDGIATDREHLSPENGRKLLASALAVVVASALLSGLGFSADRLRFEQAYLAGFVFVVTIGLGALFFVLLQHLTRAGWSVGARRHMEWIASVLPWCALLFVPVALFAHDLFPWMQAGAASDALLQMKAPYLNPTAFYLRAVFYFAAWSVMAVWFVRQSRAQDTRGDPAYTARMQRWSAPSMLLFGLTTTFAGFDWLMSLQPAWYSTIFGVYVFAGAVTSSLSLLALLTIVLQKTHLLSRVSSVEHLHDIGKLLFGFVIFWAYIAFSQYFLIWYANIPEETSFFRARWGDGWTFVSLLLAALHFGIPFLVLLSRAAKRSAAVLAVAASIVLLAHAVDVYWLVIPALDRRQGASIHAVDLAALSLPLAVLFAVVARKMADGPLFPINDPRLSEALEFTNS